MKESTSDKYLGDIIDSNAIIQETIDSKKTKGNGIVPVFVINFRRNSI